MPAINAAGLTLIQDYEGCELTAYQDSGGIWSIGFGHTPAHEGQTITQTQADQLLQSDLRATESDVQALVQVELTPNEFSALVSFEFNTGALATSPGLALINEGVDHYEEAWGSHFCLYVHDANGNTLVGLIRRRAAERALFFAE